MKNSLEFTRKRCAETAAEESSSYSLGASFNGNVKTKVADKTTFYHWMTEHEKLLRHIITGFEAKPAIQDELFQEISLNIWRALPSFRRDSAVKTFVARIAHNVLAIKR
mgnify:FL=1